MRRSLVCLGLLLALAWLPSVKGADLAECVQEDTWHVAPADPPGRAYINATGGKTLLEYAPAADNGEAVFELDFSGLVAAPEYEVSLPVTTGGTSGRFLFSIDGANPVVEETGLSRGMGPEEERVLSWQIAGAPDGLKLVVEVLDGVPSKNWLFVGPATVCAAPGDGAQ